MLTREDVERALPPTLKSAATQALTDRVNTIVSDPILAEEIRNNFIGYSSVLKEGRFKTEEYLNAVTYVSHKMRNLSNQDAYISTFPQRYADLKARSISDKDLSSYVAAYHRGKLVNLVMEQALVPVHVLNQDVYQKAINVQAELMLNAKSEKVRSDAANSLLTHLAKPKEVAGNKLEINIGENSGMTELKDLLAQTAERQRQLIESGVETREVAGTPLIAAKGKVIDQ